MYMPGLKSNFNMSTKRKKYNLTDLASVLTLQITLHSNLSEVCSYNPPTPAPDIKYYTLHLSFRFVLQYVYFLPEIIFQNEKYFICHYCFMIINEDKYYIEREERH